MPFSLGRAGTIIESRDYLLVSGNYLPEKWWTPVPDNFPQGLPEYHDFMRTDCKSPQTGWQDVSKQITVRITCFIMSSYQKPSALNSQGILCIIIISGSE